MSSLLYAAGQSGGGSGNPILGLLPFVLIIVVMYFLMIRPQRKKQKEKEEMLDNLKSGDKVLTIGGVYGTIDGIDEKNNRIILNVGKDVKFNITKSAVADRIEK